LDERISCFDDMRKSARMRPAYRDALANGGPPSSNGATAMRGEPHQQDEQADPISGCRRSLLKRWLPLAVLLAIAAAVVAMGWHDLLMLKTIGLNYEKLRAFITANLVTALALYFGIYVSVIALSLPGALILTLAGGLLFGWKLAAPTAVVAATIGATIIFLVAKSSLGEVMASRVGPWLSKLRTGFCDHALSYLLFLRLVPAFPFVVVNLAAAVLNVPLRTYVIGTFLGIIPGTTAFSVAGSGLGSVIAAQNRNYHACVAKMPADPSLACPYTIDTSALVTKELILAFVLLGVVALVPVVLKKWSARNAAC
jgi:uncharacterized membrane protein YdjX (TVP38/TMEM64 family)